MSNNKDFKVKNGIQPTVYHEGLGTVVSAVEGYSLSAASYDSKSFSTVSQNGNASGVFFKPDGTKAYVVGPATNAVLYQYGLSTAWDASTGSYDSVSFTLTDNAGNVFFKPDGTSMYVMNSTDDALDQYNLSTAWDITGSSYSQSFSYASQDDNAKGIFFKPDGTKMYIAGWTNDKVYEYNLSTAWDISSASYVQDLVIRADITNSNPTGVFFTPDGLSMIVNLLTDELICKYTLSTAWDISSASYTNVSLDVTGVATNPYQVAFKPDGTKMFVVSPTTDGVFQYSTVINTNTLDLSTGSVFEVTPTSDIQVTLSNPADSGTVSGATLLLDGAETTGVASTFSTTLYTGTATARTITNGIDLSGDGGMVWAKVRTTTGNHALFDTERGVTKYLSSDATSAEGTQAGGLTAFNTNGFTVGSWGEVNESSQDLVSWTFKKQANFFDVVTWTGTGVAGRTVSHSLGSVPAMIIVKRTNTTGSWIVYHRGLNNGNSPEDYGIILNTTAGQTDQSLYWNDTAPTDTNFTLGSANSVNGSGSTYVAYVFAHDTDASSLIKCGSYSGNSTDARTIDLGFEAQWVMVKRYNGASDWHIFDSMRGLPVRGAGSSSYLESNTVNSEATASQFFGDSQGFMVDAGDFNTTGENYIYMAIRAENLATITYDTAIEWPSGTAPTSPAIGETDVVTFNTRDGGSTYQGVLAIDGAK